MNRMSPGDEAKLVQSIEQTIALTNKGLTPDEAIFKVASEAQYPPAMVQRVVQVFNKSKAVHHLKTASADERANSIELADSDKVLAKMYKPTSQKTASEVILPGKDFSKADVKSDMMAKLASFRPEERPSRAPSPASTFSVLRKQAQISEGIRQRLYSETKLHKHAFDQALDELADHMSRLPKKSLHKVAQLVVNAYPTTGHKLMRIVSTRMNRPVPELQKMANAAVLPPQEPYLTISKVYDHAEKMAAAEVKYERFQKESAGLGSSILGSTLAGLGLSPDSISSTTQRKKKVGDLSEELDPIHYNEIKGIEAKRTFMDLVLYDKDFQQFDYPSLVKAYNDTVSMIPNSYNKPAVLKNIMMKNLESSGQKDVFEIAQEQGVQKGLASEDASKQEAMRSAKERASKAEEQAPSAIPIGSDGDGYFGRLAKGLSSGVKGGAKAIGDYLDEPDKKKKEGELTTVDGTKYTKDEAIAALLAQADKASVKRYGGDDAVRTAISAYLSNDKASGNLRRQMEQLGVKKPGSESGNERRVSL